MRRRDFIAALGGAAALPFTAHAQQGRKKVLRVGMTESKYRPFRFWWDVFKKRMAELGYVEGKNVVYESVQRPNVSNEALERALRELVSRKVDIVYHAVTERSFRTAVATVDKIPLVLATPDFDPVEAGLAQSYRRPGRNFTGLYSVQSKLTAKRLQLLKEAVPVLNALTVFWDGYSAKQWRDAPAAAANVGLDLFGVEFKKIPYDFERGFASVPAKYRGGLLVLASPNFTVPERRRLPDFALRHRLPAMFIIRNYVHAGGLMSYGANLPAMAARADEYVDLIAKGADPGTLPFAQPPKFDFAINLKTAQAMGIELPRSILLRATEVIE